MDFHDRPNRFPWPPVLFLGALGLANVFTWLFPFGRHVMPWPAILAGVALVALAAGLMLWSFLAFRAHQTSVLPNKAADALIVSGPFRLSRNPIYLSEVILLIGLVPLSGSLWYLVVAPVFAILVTRLAIIREEAHLAARFERSWTDYRARVRRWL